MNFSTWLRSAVASSRLMSEPFDWARPRSGRNAPWSESRVMQNIYKEIGRVAATPVTVLIRGATGTGKELIARAIYQHSDRADKPFIAVNCAAIPETLLESELFGHERGSFTGASRAASAGSSRPMAARSFSMKSEISPANTQAKLLRVLQEKCFQRLGGDRTAFPSTCASWPPRIVTLETAILEKEFREDLFYPPERGHHSLALAP